MDTCMTVWHWPHHPRWYDEGLKRSLTLIREAGFTHINWNPDSGSSYWYAGSEISFIARTIAEAGLKTKTIHATNGVNGVVEQAALGREDRKNIHSPHAWQREAAVELLQNRADLAASLGAKDMVLHIDVFDDVFTDDESEAQFFTPLFATLDAVQPYCVDKSVRIAVENLFCASADTFLKLFARLFDRYDQSFLGLCYDSGHWEIIAPGELRVLTQFGDRLITTHLHDNMGAKDDHLLPFDGQIDWDAVTRAIATTPYEMPLNFETPCDRYGMPEGAYYVRAHAAATRLSKMVAQARSQESGR